MANTSVSQANAVNDTLANIPFENLIGGPLTACINAQAEAAAATVQFITQVAFQPLDEDSGDDMKYKPVYVEFSFTKKNAAGSLDEINLKVPLLTIVPIPYLAITSVQIDFKASISSVQSQSNSYNSSSDYKSDYEQNKKKGIFSKTTTKLNTSFSSKKDSKSTRDSNFSVESTIDVSVRASQESMPAGMLKILEVLTNAIEQTADSGAQSANSGS